MIKSTVILIDGQKIIRKGNYQKLQQEIKIDHTVWRAYTHEGDVLAIWEVPTSAVKSIKFEFLPVIAKESNQYPTKQGRTARKHD